MEIYGLTNNDNILGAELKELIVTVSCHRVSIDSVYCMEGPKGIISGEVYRRRSSDTNIIFRYFVDPVLQNISLVFKLEAMEAT